jgi:hypothetical protein
MKRLAFIEMRIGALAGAIDVGASLRRAVEARVTERHKNPVQQVGVGAVS